MDKEDDHVALTLRDKGFNDVITRTALELKGRPNWKSNLSSMVGRVLQEIKAFNGTVLLPLGMSPDYGYVPSSDEQAIDSTHINYIMYFRFNFRG